MGPSLPIRTGAWTPPGSMASILICACAPSWPMAATISLREFIVGAFDGEMGLQAQDPELTAATAGGRMVTPAGMVLDGALDRIEPPRELTRVAGWHGARDPHEPGRSSGVLPPQLL